MIASRWVSGDMAIIDPPGDETLDGSLRTRHSCSQYPGGTRMDLAEPTGMKLCSDGLAFHGPGRTILSGGRSDAATSGMTRLRTSSATLE